VLIDVQEQQSAANTPKAFAGMAVLARSHATKPDDRDETNDEK